MYGYYGALIMENQGVQDILQKYFATTDLVVGLFTNDVFPSIYGSDSPSTFTEPVGGGYAPITIPAGSFTVEVVNNKVIATGPEIHFVFNGAIAGTGKIYGFFVTTTTGLLVAAEHRNLNKAAEYTVYFSSQPADDYMTVGENGGELFLTVKIQMGNGMPVLWHPYLPVGSGQ